MTPPARRDAIAEPVTAAWLPVRPASIPAQLRAADRWVLWRAEPDGTGKPRKVPYRVSDPERRASSTDPETWSSFADAVEAYGALLDAPADPRRGAVAGIGIALTSAGRLACIDSIT